MKVGIFKNCVKAKLRNRRVCVFKVNNKKDVLIEFNLFDKNNHNVRSLHQVRKNAIVDTGIVVTEEAAMALAECLMHYFKRGVNDRPLQ